MRPYASTVVRSRTRVTLEPAKHRPVFRYPVIGRTLTKWRDDKRTRPTGARLDARIDEVDRLLEEVMGIMRGCPPELRLRGGMDSRVQR